jgi:uroporphyrinogen-III synthase
VRSADGDASDLARLAAQRFTGVRQPLLYLAGEDRSGELAVPGLAVRTVVVYRAAKAEQFPPAVRTALEQDGIDGVLHFSRRSVESYLDCGRDLSVPALRPKHYCLSARAAEPLRLAGATQIHVAAQPDEASLLALVMPKP